MAMVPDVNALSEDWKEIELFSAGKAEGMKKSIGKIKKPEGVGNDFAAVFSPDGRLLAIAPSESPNVHVLSLDS